ncbi:MAG: prophage tail fiber N-terminal domain-containing protein [Mixta calida]|nr:prophage tail fiber N-terminal domain-containing protein [Pantoea sp.]MDU5193178.1 prophage tail fiber N-terminal domain-containing protein [Mixta calida]
MLIITGDNSGILQPQPGNFYGENMSVKITLSGVYSDPETGPLACVTLNFTTMNNSCQNQRQSEVSTTTNENAFYKISLVPNIYSVCEVDQRWQRKELGLIHIFADSQPGTLNEYLVASQPDEAQTCVLQAMQEILSETREVATTPRS